MHTICTTAQLSQVHSCTVTDPVVADTVATMSDHWTILFLKHVLESTGMTASGLAKAAGVSSTTLTRPLNSADHQFDLSAKTVEKIAQTTGISPRNFMPDSSNTSPIPSGLHENEPKLLKRTLVSVYDIEAQAGVGMVPAAYEAVVDQLAFPPEYLRSITTTPMDKLAIIGVVGASMQPTLNHGDIVMVDMTKTDIDFDGMFVIRIGEALKVKRVNWGPRRQSVVIRSDNANKIQFPDEEYFENDDVHVIGRVVWVGAKQP